MIKQLIEDIAFSNISLSQSMTRAKLIAGKTKNATFKKWLNLEIQGYEKDKDVPNYRIIGCQTFAMVALPFYRVDKVPLAIEDEELGKYYEYYNVTESISNIESTIKTLSDEVNITIQLSPSLSLLYAKPIEESIYNMNGSLRSIVKTFTKSSYESVLESVKQSLLDTLLDLFEQIPNLENDFVANNENMGKVESIVTNHIWGNNNPVNVAAGKNVIQKDITNTIATNELSKLEALGVQKSEVKELEKIILENQNNKPVLKEKAMKWVIPIITNITARGMYDHAKEVMEFVSAIVQ